MHHDDCGFFDFKRSSELCPALAQAVDATPDFIDIHRVGEDGDRLGACPVVNLVIARKRSRHQVASRGSTIRGTTTDFSARIQFGRSSRK